MTWARGGIVLTLLAAGFAMSIFWQAYAKDALMLRACTEMSSAVDRSLCLVPYFESRTRTQSTEAAITEALAFQRTGVIDDCHLIAHAVGAESLRINDGDPAPAFASCPLGCVDGCNHGVMEQYVIEHGGDELTNEEFISICDSISDEPLMHRQCIHGVGHGILRHHRDIEKAMRTCDAFQDEFSRITCKGGVSMQNAHNMIDDNDEHTIERMKTACEPLEAGSYDREICTEAIGPALMFYTLHDFERTKALCQQLDSALIEQCVTNATIERDLHNSILQ